MEHQAMTPTILIGMVLLQWIVVAAISFFKRIPKTLLASSLILAAGYINAFGVRRESAAFKAAALPQHSEGGTCALIEPGMSAEAVRTRLGKPSDVRDDGKIRGPGAVTWVYRDSRCAIHLLDEKVELVE
jgi:hypothetical protein